MNGTSPMTRDQMLSALESHHVGGSTLGAMAHWSDSDLAAYLSWLDRASRETRDAGGPAFADPGGFVPVASVPA